MKPGHKVKHTTLDFEGHVIGADRDRDAGQELTGGWYPVTMYAVMNGDGEIRWFDVQVLEDLGDDQ